MMLCIRVLLPIIVLLAAQNHQRHGCFSPAVTSSTAEASSSRWFTISSDEDEAVVANKLDAALKSWMGVPGGCEGRVVFAEGTQGKVRSGRTERGKESGETNHGMTCM
jgi:hypothetical protein